MPPSPIPAPLPPWARALLQLAPLIQVGLQEALQYIHTLNDSGSATNSGWRHVQAVFEPIGSTEAADKAVTTFDIANITNGALDNTWTDADYTTVNTALANLCSNWCPWMQNGYRFIELRYYRAAFNPLTDPHPFTKSGAPERQYSYAIPGTSTAYQARQVAWTTTEKTTYPRHWGRNYWPWPGAGASQVSSAGYIPSASVDSWAAQVQNTYATLQAAEFFPVVPVTQVDKVPTRGLLTVTKVQMDNVPDVIRRRRNKQTTYRKILP